MSIILPERLLFYAVNQTSATGMAYLALEARALGYDVMMFVEEGLYVPADVPCYRLDLDKYSPNQRIAFLEKRIVRVLKRLAQSLNRIFFCEEMVLRDRIQGWMSSFYIKKKRVEELIDRFAPTRVFVYGDRHDGYEPALLAVAYERMIPIVITPIAIGADKEALFRYRTRSMSIHASHNVTSNFTFKTHYPLQWAYDGDSGSDLSYYPPWMVHARDRCGVLPENPWSLGGGMADYLCVAGDQEKKRYIKNGVLKKKIVVTGQPEHDVLYRQFSCRSSRRLEIKESYRLSNSRIIIVGLPQLLEHNLASEQEHWAAQDTLCKAACATNWNILLSLHPKMDRNKYAYLESHYPVHILDERLRDVLPIADLYLVGQGSSTISWAVLCEVPIVIADWYGLNYKLNDWIDGKVIARDAANLEPILMGLTGNLDSLNKMRQQHQQQKHLVSPFDGECVKRILNVGS